MLLCQVSAMLDRHKRSRMLTMTINTTARANFRSDINGLRAWAVAAVIFYHFDVPGFGGGFVGVDVFFVISGFLMTGIVIRGLERDDLNLVGFYMARARRIVPALVGLCAALLGLGWLLLLPPDYQMLATHSAYSLAFLSNIEYWLEAGYFDLSSHEKWLLHTWSLSVEWQFYLILPVVLWMAWRIRAGRAMQMWAVGLTLLASIAASLWTTDTQPSAAFYLFHTRAWEMLGGGLVFLMNPKARMSATMRLWLEASGLALILASIILFDANTIWPGWRAMLPVGAAMMVLVSGRTSSWTGNMVAQWIGDRSYSLYLWHWPISVALVYAESRKDPIAIAVGLALTLILGHFSYSLIENPTRRTVGRFSLGSGAFLLGASISAVALPAILVWHMQGVTGRFPSNIEIAANEAKNRNLRYGPCNSPDGRHPPSCVFGKGPNWSLIALGDSHMEATISALATASRMHNSSAGVVSWTYHGCPFVIGMKKVRSSGRNVQCSEFIDWATLKLLHAPKNVPVVIVNRYANVAFGFSSMGERGVPEVFFSTVPPVTTVQYLNEFADKITETACKLAESRQVFLVRPIPEMEVSVPTTVSRRMAWGMSPDFSISIEQYRRRNSWVWAAQDLARDKCGVKILDPTEYLCHDNQCNGTKDGRPLYSDGDHLSEFGNKLLIPMFYDGLKTP